MGGFFGDNPANTVVGSTDATESTIAEDAVSQTDTAGGFYQGSPCLLYTSDAADDSLRVDRGGRRIIKKESARGAEGDTERT